jgi:SAM-dependent methyltransferase
MDEPTYLTTTRTGYDAIAVDFTEHFKAELQARTWERTFLAAFAEFVQADGGGVVADVGCGAGRVTGHLHELGLDVFGIDLSPGMLALARRDNPGLRFEEGAMAELDLKDGDLAGLVAWYSIIHTPPESLPAVFAEFHRVLAPGGHLAVAFQVGDGIMHYDEAFGHAVSLDFHRGSPERIVDMLTEAGFVMHATLLREAYETEPTPQAHLLARKPR